jgi:hypothetical protein
LTVKAWNGRLLLIFIDRCLEAKIRNVRVAGEQPSVELLNASLATKSLCKWFDLVERSPRYLQQSVADEIFDAGQVFLKTYLRLALHSLIEKSQRWKFLPKLHSFMHLCEDVKSSLYNCRFFTVFEMRILSACVSGWQFEYIRGRCLNIASWRVGFCVCLAGTLAEN